MLNSVKYCPGGTERLIFITAEMEKEGAKPSSNDRNVIVIIYQNGDVIGAVGVSGASADEDEYCAMIGVVETNPLLEILPPTSPCTTAKDNTSILKK